MTFARTKQFMFSQRIVLAAAALGAATGFCVAIFERVVSRGMIEPLLKAPLSIQVGVPLLGLLATALSMALWAPNAMHSLGDEYIRTFHERGRRLRTRDLPSRLLASVFTLGAGCAMGFEAISIHIGATFGSSLQHRLSRWFTREEAKVLLVAGAAAGVGAIFKAPATGALYAMEVPYQADLARRTLLPSLFSAAAGYLAFVSINGTTPLFAIGATPPLDFHDLAAAVAIGLLAGIGARGFAWLIRQAKTRSHSVHPGLRALMAGAGIGIMVAGSHGLTGESLALGPGYSTIAWAFQPDHAVGVVLGLFVVRGLATVLAVGGGGVGGLFVPLVIQGALLGAAIGAIVGGSATTLFPVLGVAAFLGAGYLVPLAAVVFVAESTGRPGFVVPGLIAAAASQLPMGSYSITTYQRVRRTGHLEGRLHLPVSSAVRTDAATVPPDATVAELFSHHVLGVRLLSVPVVDDDVYCGFVFLDDVVELDRERWDTTPVSEVMRDDVPTVPLESTLGQALDLLDRSDADRVAVTDQGRYVGIVTLGEILKLEEILAATADRPQSPPDAQARQNAT